jgi:hypothetical protein
MPQRTRTILMGAAVLTLAGAIAAGIVQWGRSAPRAAARAEPAAGHQLMLLYVGADDCAPCRTWQRGAGAEFRASSDFQRLTYREIKSPSLLDVLKDDHWPEDLRRYRDHLGEGAGVPLWLVISDQEVVERGMGPSQWASAVLPRLKLLLR